MLGTQADLVDEDADVVATAMNEESPIETAAAVSIGDLITRWRWDLNPRWA